MSFQTRYIIGPGDRIQYKFIGNEILSGHGYVLPDGKFYLPVIDDPILVAGLTVDELRELAEIELSKYIKNPKMFFSPIDIASQQVFVIGEVVNPHVASTSPLTLASVISECGGFNKNAQQSQVIVLRRNPGGDPIVFDVDFSQLMAGRSMAPDIPLQRYDIVIIPKSKVGNLQYYMTGIFGSMVLPLRFGTDSVIFHDALRNQLEVYYTK